MTSIHTELLTSGECTHSICLAPIQQHPAVPDRISYFLTGYIRLGSQGRTFRHCCNGFNGPDALKTNSIKPGNWCNMHY